MAERLAGKVVVITGGAGGIGRALAAAFLAEGARVALLDLSAAALAEAARALQPRPLTATCDVTDPKACGRAMAEVVAEEGGIDILVNNAGISHRSTFVETSDEVLRRVMEVNFFGSVHCTRAALPHVQQRRGQLVVISSVAGFAPLFGRTGYAASKHALHGFFDTLRAELAEAGVNVLLVCPSFIDTPLRRNVQVPIGGLLTPELVAGAIVSACKLRRRQLVLGNVGRLSFWVSKLAPRAYEVLMRRSQKGEVPTAGSRPG